MNRSWLETLQNSPVRERLKIARTRSRRSEEADLPQESSLFRLHSENGGTESSPSPQPSPPGEGDLTDELLRFHRRWRLGCPWGLTSAATILHTGSQGIPVDNLDNEVIPTSKGLPGRKTWRESPPLAL